jgi:hypothetical protein
MKLKCSPTPVVLTSSVVLPLPCDGLTPWLACLLPSFLLTVDPAAVREVQRGFKVNSVVASACLRDNTENYVVHIPPTEEE